jgi:hypothetical protein
MGSMIDYAALLRDLAAPRLVGSPAHAQVRQRLLYELARRGYVTMLHEFPVTPPGALAGPAYGGGAVLWASIAVGAWRGLGLTGAALVAVTGLCFVGLLATIVAHRPRSTIGGVNLIAVRPRTRVATWLAAHYDSKGQPFSMLTRIAGAGLAATGAVAVLVLAAWNPPAVWAIALALPGFLGGVVLLQNRATNRSPGAVDNASALVTVLATLDRLPPAAPIGVLFLDAEEYGLLGATALVRERSNLILGSVVLNLDGIDDLGPTRCLVHRAGPETAAVATVLGARTTGLLPVVVDGRVLGRLARECATIMRGNWRTAAVVHTVRDRADRLTLVGCETVAAGLATALGSTSRVDAGFGGL